MKPNQYFIFDLVILIAAAIVLLAIGFAVNRCHQSNSLPGKPLHVITGCQDYPNGQVICY